MINWLTAAIAGRRALDRPALPQTAPDEIPRIIWQLERLYYRQDGPYYMNRQLGAAIGFLAACKPAHERREGE